MDVVVDVKVCQVKAALQGKHMRMVMNGKQVRSTLNICRNHPKTRVEVQRTENIPVRCTLPRVFDRNLQRFRPSGAGRF